MILVDKKKHWVDFYHYMVGVYTHCQHTFQFKQIVNVHVAFIDPFKKDSGVRLVNLTCGTRHKTMLLYVCKP